MKNIYSILASSPMGCIGIGDDLPWKCKSDLKHFSNLTMDNGILIGFNTFRSLVTKFSKDVVLPGRDVIVVGNGSIEESVFGLLKQYDKCFSNVFTLVESDNTLSEALEISDKVFIAGGSKVFSKYIERSEIIYHTEILLESGDPYYKENSINLDFKTKRILSSGVRYMFDEIYEDGLKATFFKIYM